MPVTIIGGYLGAGKTTLVNHILRHAEGRRIAVLVNDFGQVSIDADLIEARTEDVIGIAGGCICCSYGSSLNDALQRLDRLDPAPEWVIVEASGVGLPGSIASGVELVPHYRVDGIFVVCNAETVRKHAEDRYLADTVKLQLEQADVIVINKIDLTLPGQLAGVERWLGTYAPRARILPAMNAQVPVDALHGTITPRVRAATEPAGHAGHTARYATALIEVPFAVSPEALAHRLSDPQVGLLRAKGIVRNPVGDLFQVHVVGARCHVEPAPPRVRGPGRLVTIGREGGASQAEIEAIVSDCSADAAR